jgi:hypothetical protein
LNGPTFTTTVFDWGTPNAHGKNPTVNVYGTPVGLGFENPDVSVVWQDDPIDANGNYHNVVVANKIDGAWGQPVLLSNSGQFSSVAQVDLSQSSSDGVLVASTGTTGPPYPISSNLTPRQITLSIPEPIGWNLVSVPVNDYVLARTAIYSGTGSAFSYQGNYVVQDPLINGAGYWLKFVQDQTVVYSGGRLTTLATPLRSGWNMIGSISDPLATSQVTTQPTGIINSNFFGYVGGSYDHLDTLQPGQGYWVRTTQAGTLIFNAPPPGQPSTQPGEPPAGLASAMLPPAPISPANSATNQQLTLTLVWNADSAATQYRVQVSTHSDFRTLLVNAGILPTKSYAVGPLSANTTYYWRVNAANSEGTTTWSTTWSFTTVSPPAAPALATPTNGATTQPLSPILTWNAVQVATRYELQVSTSSGFSSTVFDDTSITATSRQVGPLVNNGTYYWRVKAINTAGTSPWSAVWSFSVAVPPVAPVLASPSNGATAQSVTPTLTWNASSGATSYFLEVTTSSIFNGGYYYDYAVAGTSQQVGPLSGLTTYYWRVSAVNSIGTGAPSTVWTFTTGPTPIPSAPTLSSPANGSSSQPLSLDLIWQGAAYASSYQLQVSLNAGFGYLIVNQTDLSNTFQSVGGLGNGTTYYWRVNAGNNTGTSAWSDIWTFTTESAPPPDPCGGEYAPSYIASPDQLTITDAHGRHQKLFIENENRRLMNRFGVIDDQLPPEPIDSAFSVRFQSDKFVERVSADHNLKSIPILIRDAAFPITLQWNFHPDNAISYWLAAHGGEKKIQLSDSGRTQIGDPGNGGGQGKSKTRVITLQANGVDPCDPSRTVRASRFVEEAIHKPHEYALRVNFPNPFNPTTEIHYDLPEDVRVRLRVYNVLGVEVATLIDEFEIAGYKVAAFHANDLPSGVYFYRLQAGNFTDVKKMMLMR